MRKRNSATYNLEVSFDGGEINKILQVLEKTGVKVESEEARKLYG